MVTITKDAAKFVSELLEKNKKAGYGVKIYLAGMACSGPQFGMSFQEKAEEGDTILKIEGLTLFYDADTAKELDECVIEFVDDPNYGTGLTINNPNMKGCASCSSSGCK
jgi:iron-sulfur cluster assembly accessory protein